MRGFFEKIDWRIPLGVATAALAVQLVKPWHPAKFIPTSGDVKAGDALVEKIRGIPGPVWVPYHPWLAHLAGKDLFADRMGFMEMRLNNRWKVAEFSTYMASARFAAIILDKPADWPFREMKHHYRWSENIEFAPRTYSGVSLRPRMIYVPVKKLITPPGHRRIFDLDETASWSQAGWLVTGTAWGPRPVSRSLLGQSEVGGYRGSRFASSMHGKDAAQGVLTSPTFEISGSSMIIPVGGGVNQQLRVELLIENNIVRKAQATQVSELITDVHWDVADLLGKTAQLRFVDVSSGGWGHLNFGSPLISNEQSLRSNDTVNN